MKEREVRITNPLGLHARAAARFVSIAAAYECDILVHRGERHVNGKSIMGLMMLAAGRGTLLTVTAEGNDEDAALDALTALVADGFGETRTAEE